ncbi:MAG: TFIIB-type zinc ribbon-containing protein [Christensenellaceae bacterium]|nr:TFIIB-type zinc ribbon-containing protein [Christensenellaceae bacterium]
MNDTSEFDVAQNNPGIQNQTDVAKCPGCGANLVFSPEKGALFCEHCETVLQFESETSSELSLNKLFSKTSSWGEETHIFSCPNCGASEIIAKNEISKACPYCGSVNVLEKHDISGLKPNAVVPFKLNKNQASEMAKKWAKRRIFAPSSYKKSIEPEGLNGVYTPAFTFDSYTYTQYSGVLERTEQRTTRVNGKTVVKTVSVRFNISGTFSHFFDDLVVRASKKIEEKFFHKLLPFDTNNSETYNDSFIHGFSASQYDMDGPACWDSARQTMKAQIKQLILRKYTYTSVVSFNATTSFNDNKFKYVLLPIYIGHSRFKEKLYNLFINGSTGKASGKTPISPIRVGIASILGLGVLIAIIFMIFNII